jgi:hypothetical protein
MPQNFPLFSESLENFHFSAKVSNLVKFLGMFLVKFDQKQWKTTRKSLFFLLYKQPKQCHNFCTKKFVYSIWQTTTFHYSAKILRLSTIRRKSKTLSYLDFVLCSINQPQLKQMQRA